MEKIKNSCGGEGCQYIRVLPTCGSVKHVPKGVLQKANDTTLVLRPYQNNLLQNAA